ncbi:hypothetical protein PR202_ga08882 [Eleusine coracana subsp. coracana]|uniref:RNase H type-1 domain-containing protein n=1 Tax=Eleusine coracana subsp. coracana TaxID=191504 RepID=A0AAV5C3Q6_ELECO|nr:hypothetical protein PR202_ga08882 [Eleusine coracana subsp. coracana]
MEASVEATPQDDSWQAMQRQSRQQATTRDYASGDGFDLKGERKVGERVGQNTMIPTGTKEPEAWVPPSEGWVKINMDGAFESGDASAGIIIRNSQGHAVMSAWQPVRRCNEAMEAEAEAEACLVGIQLANEWVRKPSVIESDCLELIRLLQGEQKTRVAWSTLILEVKAACQVLPEVRYIRVRRETNSVAHTLAKVAKQISSTPSRGCALRLVLGIQSV